MLAAVKRVPSLLIHCLQLSLKTYAVLKTLEVLLIVLRLFNKRTVQPEQLNYYSH